MIQYVDFDSSQQVTSLLAQGRRLYVGTLSGIVAAFDSQSLGLIARYSWHEGKVRSLLVLPEQVKSCLCAEVPLKTESKQQHIPIATRHVNNKCYMSNSGYDLELIASIGNGRIKYNCTEEKKDLENSMSFHSRHFSWMNKSHEDITLLVWHS